MTENDNIPPVASVDALLMAWALSYAARESGDFENFLIFVESQLGDLLQPPQQAVLLSRLSTARALQATQRNDPLLALRR